MFFMSRHFMGQPEIIKAGRSRRQKLNKNFTRPRKMQWSRPRGLIRSFYSVCGVGRAGIQIAWLEVVKPAFLCRCAKIAGFRLINLHRADVALITAPEHAHTLLQFGKTILTSCHPHREELNTIFVPFCYSMRHVSIACFAREVRRQTRRGWCLANDYKWCFRLDHRSHPHFNHVNV